MILPDLLKFMTPFKILQAFSKLVYDFVNFPYLLKKIRRKISYLLKIPTDFSRLSSKLIQG